MSFRNKKESAKAAFDLGKEILKMLFNHVNENAINAESRLA